MSVFLTINYIELYRYSYNQKILIREDLVQEANLGKSRKSEVRYER